MGLFGIKRNPEEEMQQGIGAASEVIPQQEMPMQQTVAIGEREIQEATQTLQKYKAAKANLDNRVVKNEEWYKLRNWNCFASNKDDEIKPVSAWLFNCIANKHASAMDAFPSPNILPREEGDKGEAKMLSSIIPVILEQNNFEEAYDKAMLDKLKSGTAIYKVSWDSTKLNGLGDISITDVDILSLFWEGGIEDIQKSKNFFHTELVDNDTLIAMYPECEGKLSNPTFKATEYIYDDSVDTSNMSVVVDWYYKKKNANGVDVLHYVKYVNNVVLYATENDAQAATEGLYRHGKYPYVFDAMYNTKGTPAGFGYVDVGKSAQEYIDRCDKVLLENMLTNAKPRFFVRDDGAVNEEEFQDLSNDIVHVKGNLSSDSIMPITPNTLQSVYVSMFEEKINEIKETTGNRDVNNGGVTGGATAASAIASLQEASSRLDRDCNRSSYRAFRSIVLLVIELIRQFYDLPRSFRIMGMNGAEEYVTYSNIGIQPIWQGNEFGVDMGSRIPLFDVSVTAEKQSPYSKMAQNELALQFYQLGFFNPQLADQSLACLDMMDFDNREQIMQKIQQNGTMMQMIMQLQQQMMALGQMVDKKNGSNEVTNGLMQQFGMAQPMPNASGEKAEMPEISKESSITKDAREKVATSVQPK